MKKRILSVLITLCTILSCIPIVNADTITDERISEDYVRIFRDALDNKILKDNSYRMLQPVNLANNEIINIINIDYMSAFNDAHILDYDGDSYPELIVSYGEVDSRAVIYEYDDKNETVYADKSFVWSYGHPGAIIYRDFTAYNTYMYYNESNELVFYCEKENAIWHDDLQKYEFIYNIDIIKFKNGQKEILDSFTKISAADMVTTYNGYSENSSEGMKIKAKEINYDKRIRLDNYKKGSELTKYYIPPIKVILNGSEVGFDVYPEIANDRTFVPIRAICEAMGYDVEWNQDTLSATISRKNILMTVQLNNNHIEVQNLNGVSRSYTSDVAPRTINDRVLIPVRAICECLGSEVTWDGDNRIVYINYDPYPLEHISFTGNTDYTAHKKNGGMAGEIKDRYVKSWGIDVAHFLWDFVTVAKDVATIDGKGLVNDIIKRDDLQYELILNEMLMSTAIEESYAEIFEEEYYDVIIPILDLAAFADADEDDGDILKSESKVRAEIQQAANKGHSKNTALSSAIASYINFADAQGGGKLLSEIFNTAKGSADYNKIIAHASTFSTAADIAEIANRSYDNFTDAVNSVAAAIACGAADERFITAVEGIRDYVTKGIENGTITTDNKDFAEGFSKAVDNYIKEFNFNRKSRELAIIKKVSDESAVVVASLGADIARTTITSGMWAGEVYNTVSQIFPEKLTSALGGESFAVLAGINLGFDKGVSLADAIFDTSDTEYNQKYLMKLGVIAQAASQYLDKLTDNLKTHERTDPLSAETREDAELLHCALNVYKAIQISGLDKAKQIEEAKGWFKNGDTLSQINKWHNTLMSLECH